MLGDSNPFKRAIKWYIIWPSFDFAGHSPYINQRLIPIVLRFSCNNSLPSVPCAKVHRSSVHLWPRGSADLDFTVVCLCTVLYSTYVSTGGLIVSVYIYPKSTLQFSASLAAGMCRPRLHSRMFMNCTVLYLCKYRRIDSISVHLPLKYTAVQCIFGRGEVQT